jgi:hypothetical protein
MFTELICKVLINILFISLFISIFFFTYGTYLENTVITAQMNILANNFMDMIKLSGNKTNIDLKNYITDNILAPSNIANISSGDKDALKGNSKIIKMVSLYIIIFTSAVFVIIIGLKLNNINNNDNEDKLDLKHIFTESFIILIFIVITYYSFITFFGGKFISINPNAPKLEIIKMLQKYNNSLNGEVS